MADIVDAETRSRMMAAIRGADTRPEMVVRRGLHAVGFRFRLHDRRLPGSPDLVLRRWNAVIFVHGCFWHRHPGCRFATTPASSTKPPGFWQAKFARTMERDREAVAALERLGWRVAVVWECSLSRRRAESTLASLADWLTRMESSLFETPKETASAER